MSFTAGQILTAAQLNGVTQQAGVVAFTSSGSLTALQVGTARTIRIRGCNGGAGGGGAATTGASQSAAGGPGGSGAYAEITLSVSALTFPLAVTVGGGGAGGSAGNNAGTKGGQSKVVDNNGSGSTLWTPGIQATNQAGSGCAAAATVGDATSGGFDASVTSSVGDIIFQGMVPQNPTRVAAGVCTRIAGASSPYGAGGNPGNGGAGSSATAGYGAGGGGAYLGASQSAAAGGSGSGGFVLVEIIA